MTAIEIGFSSEQLEYDEVGREPDVDARPRIACLGRTCS